MKPNEEANLAFTTGATSALSRGDAMTRLGSVLLAFLAWPLIGAAIVLLPSSARADCAKWDMSGEWALDQGNGFRVVFSLTQTGNTITGSANYGLDQPQQKLKGTINSFNNVTIEVEWNSGTIAVYTGSLDSGGHWGPGTTYDKTNQSSSSWKAVSHNQVWGNTPATCLAEAAPFVDFCNRYANDAVAQAKKNLEMKCGLEKVNPTRWTANRDDHFNWCMSWEGANSEPASEGSYRVVGLKQCADTQAAMKEKANLTPGPKVSDILEETKPSATPAPTPPPGPSGGPPAGGKTATVILDVEVYDKPDDPKVKIGELGAGTQGVFLAEPCRADNWCHLTGNVPKGNGWSWSGPGYGILGVLGSREKVMDRIGRLSGSLPFGAIVVAPTLRRSLE